MLTIFNSDLTNLNSFQAHTDVIERIKQSPFTNQYVATCSNDFTVKIWDPNNNWNLIREYFGHFMGVYSLEWINENTIASGSLDRTLQIWSISTGFMQRKINLVDWVVSFKLLSNGYYLAAGTWYNINIYNINTGGLIFTLIGHQNYINDLVLINSVTLASASMDKTIRIWDLTKQNAKKFILNGHTASVYSLKVISSSILASGSWDTTIKLWNTTSGTLIRTLTGHKDYIYWSLDLFTNGKTLASGSLDQTIKLWNWSTGQCLNSINTSSSIFSLEIIKSIL